MQLVARPSRSPWPPANQRQFHRHQNCRPNTLNVLGGTPKTAVETTALPNPIEWIRKGLHSHDLVAAIDVDDLSRDGGCAVACEECSGGTQLIGEDIALQRRVGLVFLEHVGKA